MSSNEDSEAPLWALTRLEVADLFQQERVWADIRGREHVITEMSTVYLVNVSLKLLDRNDEPPVRAFLLATPLWRALERELASRPL